MLNNVLEDVKDKTKGIEKLLEREQLEDLAKKDIELKKQAEAAKIKKKWSSLIFNPTLNSRFKKLSVPFVNRIAHILVFFLYFFEISDKWSYLNPLLLANCYLRLLYILFLDVIGHIILVEALFILYPLVWL